MGCARPACDALVARRRRLPRFAGAATAARHRARLRRSGCRRRDSGDRGCEPRRRDRAIDRGDDRPARLCASRITRRRASAARSSAATARFDARLAELDRGSRRAAATASAIASSPVLVPPWNRIADELVAAACLRQGCAVSRASARAATATPSPRIVQVEHARGSDRVAARPRVHRRRRCDRAPGRPSVARGGSAASTPTSRPAS